MKLCTSLLLTLTLGVPAVTFACVDPQDGSFCIAICNTHQSSADHALDTKRIFSTRLKEPGWLGWGWITPFETRLTILPDGSASVLEGETGKRTIYHPADVHPDATANSARAAPLQGEGCENETVTPSAEGYKRFTCSGNTEYFDHAGRMTRHIKQDGYQYVIHYASQRPNSVTDSLGKTVRFTWTPSGRLITADYGAAYISAFSYDAQENLVSTSEADTRLNTFDYDQNHQPTRIGYQDGTHMAIAYTPSDPTRVSATLGRNGDKTTYAYRVDASDTQHTWTTVVTHADTDDALRREYEYRMQTDAHGRQYAAQSTERSRFKTILLRRDNQSRIVHRSTGPGDAVNYVYHPKSGKLVLALGQDIQYEYHYDAAGNLTQAKSSEGLAVDLVYDAHMLIQSMDEVNHAAGTRRKLSFKYNAAGKPVVITMRGVGSIRVEYDAQGEITKVSSANGPSMALLVTQAFQSLLALVQAPKEPLGT